MFGFVGVVGDTGLIHHIATIGNTCRTYFWNSYTGHIDYITTIGNTCRTYPGTLWIIENVARFGPLELPEHRRS